MTRRRYFLGNLLAIGLWFASVILVTLIIQQPIPMTYGAITGFVLGRFWFRYWRRAYEASNRKPVVWSAAQIHAYNRSMVDRDVQ